MRRLGAMRFVVVGAGSWGTTFAGLLHGCGHEVTLACRDPADADAMRRTGRNPRYATGVALGGITPAVLRDAAVETTDVVVVAVPSRVFRAVVASLPGTAPIVSLTKGLDPGTGSRLSTLVR